MKQKGESQSQDTTRAAAVLKTGGVIIFPTDTVYGIGCLHDNQKAVDRIYSIKGTQKSQAFPVLVSSISQVKRLAHVTKTAENLMKKYWPGGLTIIIKNKEGGKTGFRMPDSKPLLSIIEKTGPIIGTSANFHDQKTPRSFRQLDPQFTNLADFVLKGACKTGIESTVVDTAIDPPKILRQGAVNLTTK